MSVFVSNVTNDTIEFLDPEVGFVTSSKVGILNTAPVNTLDIGSNVSFDDESTDNTLVVRGGIIADTFAGDGGLISNVVMTSDLDDILSRGANTVYTLEFQNNDVAFTTTGNVGIINTSPIHTLDVGSNLYVDDTGPNVLFVRGNTTVTGNITAHGNIIATNFVGDGTFLTNVTATATLKSATEQGNATYETLHLLNPDYGLLALGNVGVANTQPVHTLDVGTKFRVAENSPNVLVVDGIIVAQKFIGDGNSVTNVISGTSLQGCTDNGNVTSNTVQFANSVTGFVTFSNVGICNTDPVHNLDVGSNLYIQDDVGEGEILTVTGNIRAYYFKGDGRYLSNVPTCSICSTYDYVTNIGNTSANTVRFVGNTTSLITESNIGIANEFPMHSMAIGSNIWFNDPTETTVWTSGNIECNYIIADGSRLYNLPSNLETVVNNGNITTNIAYFVHPTECVIVESNIKTNGDCVIDAPLESSIRIGGVKPDGPLHSPGLSNVERVSIGTEAGKLGQAERAIAIGAQAGYAGQGESAVSLGIAAGEYFQGAKTVAIGERAGNEGQNAYSTAIGYRSALSGQSQFSTAIGSNAGSLYQGSNAVAIGEDSGFYLQGDTSVAIGAHSGRMSQGDASIAIGAYAGNEEQGDYSFAIGQGAGRTSQGDSTLAMGHNAGESQQGSNSYAIGHGAGRTSQGDSTLAMGHNAGESQQGSNAIAIGHGAGQVEQGGYSVAIGLEAGQTSQKQYAIALGQRAGASVQGENGIAVGYESAASNQGDYSIAMGYFSGTKNQSANSIAIGSEAGTSTQGSNSVAIGTQAGFLNQGDSAVAIGTGAGYRGQGDRSIAIGDRTAAKTLGYNAIAMGYKSNSTGSNSIAIGSLTSLTTANTIAFNATNQEFAPTIGDGLYITPVRNYFYQTEYSSILTYTSNNEIISQNNFYMSEAGNVYLYANLIVTGNFSTVSSENFAVDDNILLLANNNTGGLLDMGIIMQRAGSNVVIGYDESLDEMVLGYTDDHQDVSTITPKDSNLHVHVYGTIEADTNISIGYDLDTYSYIGKSVIGNVGHADNAGFAHLDFRNSTSYALRQDASGTTHVNAQTGQQIIFRNNDVDIVTIDDNGINGYFSRILSNGYMINGPDWNGSANATWDVNGSTSDIPNTVVVRDGSGGFEATSLHTTGNIIATGTITAPPTETISAGDLDVSGDYIQNGVVMRPLPLGSIVLWSGSAASIPSGWALCDGGSGTPDLRDRFVVGAALSYNPGDTGGSASVALTAAQMPSHAHSVSSSATLSGSTSTIGAHSHNYLFRTEETKRGPGPYSVWRGTQNYGSSSSGSHSHTLTGSVAISTTTGSTGSGNAHENRPPYYALCYIMAVA